MDFKPKRITILDDRSICSHAEFCTDELKSVFRQHDTPWIAPDEADVEEIIATIGECPSGALGYAIDDAILSERGSTPRRART